jgi:hypothetical protein
VSTFDQARADGAWNDNGQQTAVNPVDVLTQLNQASIGLDQASDELRQLMPRYEGYEDPDGTFHPGVKIRWDELVGDKLDALIQRYEDKNKRPPAKEVVQIRAEREAKKADPELWAAFHATEARMTALQTWIASKSKTISAKQSILRAEGILAGQPPAWGRHAA